MHPACLKNNLLLSLSLMLNLSAACGPAARAPAEQTARFSAPDERCNQIMIAVTATHYVWLENQREQPLTQQQILRRLRPCRSVLATEKMCTAGGERCSFRQGPLWVELPDNAVPEQREQLVARERALGQALERMGIPAKRSGYTYPRRGLALYRSRAELGPSAELVPDDFDFSRRWLARVFFPNGRWTRRCLDEDLGRTPEQSEARSKQRAARRERLLHGRAARLVQAKYRYGHGRLEIVVPAPGNPPPRASGPCQYTADVEAVLAPVPHTLVPVADTAGYGR